MTAGLGAEAPDLVTLKRRTESTITRMASELHAAIEAEREGRADIEREVEESRTRERRLVKVLTALEGGPPAKPGRKPKSTQPAGQASRRIMHVTLEALRAADRPMTVIEVQEAIGAGSRETARKALEQLRTEGEVRKAGAVMSPNGRTPSHTYAAMPSGKAGENGAGPATD